MKIVKNIEAKLRTHDHQWCMKRIDLSIMLIIPLDKLRKMSGSPPKYLRIESDSIPNPVNHCNVPFSSSFFFALCGITYF